MSEYHGYRLPNRKNGMTTPVSTRGRLALPLVIVAMCVLAAVPRPALAADTGIRQSLVGVNSYRATRVERSGTGVVVHSENGDSYVVTGANLLVPGGTITVNVPGTGAELIATELFADDASAIAVLHVAGLALPAVVFAEGAPDQGEIIRSTVYGREQSGAVDLFKGSVSRTYAVPGSSGQLQMFIHNVPIGEGGVGAPLLNDCGEVVGITTSSQGVGSGVAYALRTDSLVGVLRRASLAVAIADTQCPSLVEQAKRDADLASTKAIEAREQAVAAMSTANRLAEQLQKVNKLNEALQLQTGEAQSRADRAIEEASGARREAAAAREEVDRRTSQIKSETQDRLQEIEKARRASEAEFHARLEEQRKESERREMLYWGAIFVLALLFSALIVLQVRRRGESAAEMDEERRPPRSTTEMQTPDFTEYILDGADEHGIRYLLRISGDQLSTPQGAVIGRNPPDSPYVINHSDVSRKHARLRIIKNRLFIEDLGSTNGTTVNGQSIDNKGSVTLNNGDQVIMGSVVLRLRSIPA